MQGGREISSIQAALVEPAIGEVEVVRQDADARAYDAGSLAVVIMDDQI